MKQDNKKPATAPKPKIRFFWIKTAIFLIISLLCVYGVFRVSAKFQTASVEAKKLRAEIVAAQIEDQKQILEFELEKYEEDIGAIQGYFPTEGEILDLLVQLDNLKRSGAITDFLITSDTAVADKLGLLGLPLSVTVTGDQTTINSAMEALHNLPFLIRPVVLNIERLPDGNLSANYGGFVYVNENFNQDR